MDFERKKIVCKIFGPGRNLIRVGKILEPDPDLNYLNSDPQHWVTLFLQYFFVFFAVTR